MDVAERLVRLEERQASVERQLQDVAKAVHPPWLKIMGGVLLHGVTVVGLAGGWYTYDQTQREKIEAVRMDTLYSELARMRAVIEKHH